MRDGKDLRPEACVFRVDHGAGKSIEVIDAHAVPAMRTTLLILEEEPKNSLVLGEESLCAISRLAWVA